MPRIPDEEIEQIKTSISIQQLVTAAGVELKSHGADLIGHCPFHDDKTPSLVISLAKNLWHCLGACQQGGSVIDWVMQKEKVSFRYAAELLREGFPALAAKDGAGDKAATNMMAPAKLEPLLSSSGDHQSALKRVIDFYHRVLKQSPEALDYLSKRGLNHPELIDQFKIGYANRTLGYRLPSRDSKAGKDIRDQLQGIGLIRQSGHEHFSGSIVIPVISEEGIITDVYGRKILGKQLRKGTPMHTYLPGPHQGVWNSRAFKVYDEMILCESLIDALSFYAAGILNVTASYGTSGFTKAHLEAFKNNAIKKIYIAYDRDEAGNKGAEKLADELATLGMECFRIQFPMGMDANEYACEVKPADKSLEVLVRKALWMKQGMKQAMKQDATQDTEQNTDNANNAEQHEIDAIKSEKNHTDNTSDTETHISETPNPNPSDTENNNVQSNHEAEQTQQSNPLPSLAANPMLHDVKATISDNQITIDIDARHYRIRGLEKNLSYEQLKINLLIRHQEKFHVDTLDVYSARHRSSYIKQAAAELLMNEDIIKQDLGRVLLKLEELQDQQIKGSLSPKDTAPKMSDRELKAALNYLESPNLTANILQDFDKLGIVGESTNKLVGYLAAVSRKLDKPLAVMVQSSSAAGKSSLMDAILSLMPEEERIQYSAMTGQSLFYMGEQDLKHKILAIAEEEGASQTAYGLKLLQSEGEVSIASTGKNATTGNLETQIYRVEGPVMLFSTTTAIDIDEELMNRCLVLSVDESRTQTQAIHKAQRSRRTLEGLRAKTEKQNIKTLHQNAQRLLNPLAVLNPYADQLTFLDDKTRTRRDHEKYLTLIDTVTLLHQYQRPLKKDKHKGEMTHYIEVTLDDIKLANTLAHEVLGRTLDELPPQTHCLLQLITNMVSEVCEQQQIKPNAYYFGRKAIRDYTGWSDGQLKIHCHRLEELEYLLVHGGGRGKPIRYELLYDGNNQINKPHLVGLIDTTQLKSRLKTHCDEQKSGQKPQKSAPSQGQVSPKLGGSQGSKSEENFEKNSLNLSNTEEAPKTALLTEKNHHLESNHNQTATTAISS